MSTPPNRPERTSVPARYVGVATSLLARRGLAVDALLREAGVDPATLTDPDARIALAELAPLVATHPELARDLELAFELGRATKPTAHGALGYALLTSASVGDAVRIAERFVRLRLRVLHLRSHVEGDDAVLEFEEVVAFGPYRPFVLAWAAGVVLCVADFLLGDVLDVDAVAVRLTMDAPDDVAVLRRHLPNLAFGHRQNEVRFPAAWLAHPLPLSDESAASAARAVLERELALHGDDDVDLVARVRALFEDESFGFRDLEAAASRLGMSSRTLRRHLAQHRTTYQELLTEARKSRAIARLRDDAVGLEQLALELGYENQANFSRAFLKWTGTTPGAFRRGG